MRRLSFILGLSLLLASQSIANTIYISQQGSDSASGARSDQAVRSIKRVNEILAAAPGTAMSVYFRRGDTFDVAHTANLPALRIIKRSAGTIISTYGALAQRPKIRFLGSANAHWPTI